LPKSKEVAVKGWEWINLRHDEVDSHFFLDKKESKT
jgi:hypothetical protein